MSGNKIGALLASTAFIGAMTPIERERGRYMRAPDHADAEFSAFEAAGEVEVGAPEVEKPEEKPEKPARSGRGPREKPADKAADDKGADDKPKPADKAEAEEGEENEDAAAAQAEEDEEEEEKPAKAPKKASERIRELNARLRQEERLRRASDERLERLEKTLLPNGGNGGNHADAGKEAPDPTDTKLYPLGHLDDRYIEDKLEWLADKKATDRADAVLLRQQETEQKQAAEKAHAELLERVDDLKSRGSEISDDFEESVIESGIRGDWKLGQATFEAAHEADNGAQILYELSQDKKEAARVAGLSPFQQMRFVIDRDAEISSKAKPRTKPGAGAPPSTTTRGANSSHRISPATDDLVQFEKAWVADEKG
jgi:hypothetical protein